MVLLRLSALVLKEEARANTTFEFRDIFHRKFRLGFSNGAAFLTKFTVKNHRRKRPLNRCA